MKILKLEAEGILGLPDGSYSFCRSGDEPAPVVLISGQGACGKTSLLKAIAAAKEIEGPYGVLPKPEKLLRDGAGRGRLKAWWLLTEAEIAFAAAHIEDEEGDEAGKKGAEADVGAPVVPPVITTEVQIPDELYSPFNKRYRPLFSDYRSGRGKVELFPDNRRLLPAVREVVVPPIARNGVAARLTDEPGKYGIVREALRDVALAEGRLLQERLAATGMVVAGDHDDLLAPYKRNVAKLLDHLRLTEVDVDVKGQLYAWFARADGYTIELDHLSSSESQAVLFAASYQRLGLNDSVVLIDTPELFVPQPKRLAFFNALLTLGHDNQVIAATASAELLRDIKGIVIELPSIGGSS